MPVKTFAFLLCLWISAGTGLYGQIAKSTGRDSIILPNPQVDSLFKQFDNPNSPGGALGVIRNGRFIYVRGYGMADLEKQIPISSRTIFNIASLSKQFTAACILLLQQQGKLSLDDNIRRFIPEFPDYGKPITIKQLLNHTSGIRDYVQLMFLAGSRYDSNIKMSKAFDMIRRQKELNFNPGDEWLYSNSGYVLAAIIIERVSGESLPTFEEKNIFDPLGMKNTFVIQGPTPMSGIVASGYEPLPGGRYKPLVSNWEDTGDGNIYTTLEDLLRWDNNFYDYKIGGRVMTEELLHLDTLNNGFRIGYAFGLGVGNYRGLKTVSHEGEWAGYRAELIRFPEQQFSVILLCNLSTIVPLRLAQQVSEIYLGKEMEKVSKNNISQLPLNIREPDSTELSRYCGFFRNPEDEMIRQTRIEKGKLMYVRDQNSFSELVPIGKDTFFMKGVPVATNILFTSLKSGQVTGLIVNSKDSKPVYLEKFIRTIPTSKMLATFCGIYHSEELNTDFSIVYHDSSLFLVTTGPGEDLLLPTVAGIFKLGNTGVIRFSHSNAGIVDNFKFSFGKVHNLLFVRKA